MKKVIVAGVLIFVVVLVVAARNRSRNGPETIKREGVEGIQRREGFPVRLTPVENGVFEVWREIQGSPRWKTGFSRSGGRSRAR